MKLISTVLLLAILLWPQSVHSQPGTIQKEALRALEQLPVPESVSDFKTFFHLPPVNQDTTNACWSFATTSFIESEMQRLGLEPVKLAVMYPVYWSFVEKARRFVQKRGDSHFAPGDLFTGVTEIVKKYGILPEIAYRGQTRDLKTYNHKALENELKSLMNHIKLISLWDEELVITKVRQILDMHLSQPPEKFEFKGNMYTPKSFLNEIVRLPWDEYTTVTSFLYAPFYQFVELKVPDNWNHYDTYYNVPLDVFYESLRTAIINGYSAAFDSDTGEPGRIGEHDVVFVPPYDIPGQFINQRAREFRFNNKSTTDDHLMHIIGFAEYKGHDWFLVKDSWRTAWLGEHKGYYFFHRDYLKLKALAYIIHRDAIPEIIKSMR